MREPKGNTSYYLLKKTDVPLVIVECGFLSNAEEAELLTDDDYQTLLARAVCRGVKGLSLIHISLAPNEVVLCFREIEEEKRQQFQERKLLEDCLLYTSSEWKSPAKCALFS